ncbi:flagellar biosynthesis protein FliA [Massilia violaceinigra]|uniref:Flagellar biosynthesis protein FliA n=1 Tax=Massilia violaceinigra TaxID=2045208 RepID=A0A2D2DH67_9BURK|nr:sigma-70 family RNA polymerase sigma factor [Massilia violaceinigra]ATQ74332.1 flagellar biosynthesis protein FliA [Massilia violaceinigra]
MKSDAALIVPGPAAAAGAAASATERLWARFVQAREASVREQLVGAYLGFARMMAAKTYARRVFSEMEFADYLQYARVGLIEAIDRFDPARGYKFETYAAARISGAVMSGIETSSEIQQQIGARRRVLAQRVESLRGDAAPPTGPEAVFARLAELAVGLAVGFALEGSDMHRAEDAQYADNSYHGVQLKQCQSRVRAMVEALPATQKQVIYSHYLQQVRFDDIAASLDLSRSRIAQIHRDALATLRSRLPPSAQVDLRC